MDRNGDGSVDKKELFSWILRSFRSLSQEESTDRFHDTDDDQVSKFSMSRFTHKIKLFFSIMNCFTAVSFLTKAIQVRVNFYSYNLALGASLYILDQHFSTAGTSLVSGTKKVTSGTKTFIGC